MRHLVSVRDISPHEVKELFQTADVFREHYYSGSWSGEVVLLFYEPSTRTRVSFELAAGRLGLRPVSIVPETASVQKGEGPEETVKTVAAMGVRAIVLRTREEGLPRHLAELDVLPVINAGDGKNEHPTQALLDLYTLRRTFGERLEGLTVAIVGDIVHSRVARSDTWLFSSFGIEVRLVGPPALVPDSLAEVLGAPVFHDLEAALVGADVVMALRIQRERARSEELPEPLDYHRRYGITSERLGTRYLMHPGPANLGVEVASDVVDHEHSLIRAQVENGVFVRMAVLDFIARGARVL